MRTAIGFWALLLASACGGNVAVEHGSGGATSSTTASSSGATGASTTTTPTSSSSSSSGVVGIPDCTTFGLVGAGLKCNQEGMSCRMDYACCQGSITCEAGVWTADPPACAQPCLNCGDGLTCSLDAICVHDTAVYDSYQCVKNPCPGMPDCSCAAAVCGMNFQQCKSVQMYTVTCGN
jgi:hypothetical protein